MSTNIAEFIQEWNNVFQVKLSENDLHKPNEVMLFRPLKNLLENRNINVNLVMQTILSGGDERRFKVKFCKYIDYLYKISNESNNFYYYDLINPLPRKTLHLLRTLLNYSLFYKMLKEEVVDKATLKIKEHDTIKEKKIKFLIENEKEKLRAKSIEKQLVEVDKCLLARRQHKNQLMSQNKNLLNSIAEVDANNKRLNSANFELDREKQSLQANVVTNAEALELINSISKVENEIKELKELKIRTINANLNYDNKTDALESTIRKIESITLASEEATKELEKTIQLKSELNQLTRQTEEMNAKLDEMNQNNSQLMKQISFLNNTLKMKQNHHKETEQQFDSNLNDFKKKIETEESRRSEVDITIASLNDDINELKLIYNFIESNGKKIVHGIKHD